MHLKSILTTIQLSCMTNTTQQFITVHITQTIEHNHHHIAGPCLTDVLENWLDRTIPQPKWTDIIFALRSSAVRRGDIAKHVETMLKGQEVPANRTV